MKYRNKKSVKKTPLYKNKGSTERESKKIQNIKEKARQKKHKSRFKFIHKPVLKH